MSSWNALSSTQLKVCAVWPAMTADCSCLLWRATDLRILASATLRKRGSLNYDAVFGGPLEKGPMYVRVSLENSLSSLVGN